MAEVVVVGGSFAGIAAAVRLAKLGHRVTLCESGEAVAGEFVPVERDGYRWDAGPPSMLLPAPLRDLFHKSGRPLERVAELVPVDSARRHLHAGSVIDLPLTGRGRQTAAFEAVRGPKAAAAWTELVDSYEAVWECLRTKVLETPFDGPRSLRREDRRILRPRQSLAGRARRLPDPLARAVVEHYATMVGGTSSSAPGFVGVLAYVERTFGRWRFPGGMDVLRDALVRRLDERKVAVRTGATVAEITTDGSRVTGVRLADGEVLRSEIVVSAVNATRLYGQLLPNPPRTQVHRARPVPRPNILHLGVAAPLPEVPFETVVHPSGDEPTIVLYAPRDPAMAPPGHAAWTVVTNAPADPLVVLARHGIDLREAVRTRVDGHPHGLGFAWRGARTAGHRAANRAPLDGLFCVGPTAHPGAGLPFEAMGAASVAELIGKAPRVHAGRAG